mmetsp:Transcript_20046/g.52063  ORF Transcript_20046/g.52063 Transcript_20046/m.52063 type:complete len:276 (+) Transcript_20046:68-895(+)
MGAECDSCALPFVAATLPSLVLEVHRAELVHLCLELDVLGLELLEEGLGGGHLLRQLGLGGGELAALLPEHRELGLLRDALLDGRGESGLGLPQVLGRLGVGGLQRSHLAPQPGPVGLGGVGGHLEGLHLVLEGCHLALLGRELAAEAVGLPSDLGERRLGLGELRLGRSVHRGHAGGLGERGLVVLERGVHARRDGLGVLPGGVQLGREHLTAVMCRGLLVVGRGKLLLQGGQVRHGVLVLGPQLDQLLNVLHHIALLVRVAVHFVFERRDVGS